MKESVEGQDVLLAQKFDPATHVRERLARPPAFSRRHAHENEPKAFHIGRSCSCAIRASSAAFSRGVREAAAHQFEQSRVHVPVRMGADMRQARDPRLRVANEGNRPSDVAHRPQRSAR